MGFNLWLDSYRNIENYYLRRFDGRTAYGQIMLGDSANNGPLFLNIDGVYKCDFTLDEIDSFTSGCKDLEDVRNNFSKFGGYENIALHLGSLYIASKSDNIGKYQVVYNSPLLKKCAMVIREKRQKHLPEFLDRTPELQAYVQKLANYAVKDITGPSIRNFSLLPPHVKAVLQQYNNSINNDRIDISERCFENLFSYCMNYKTLRAFIIWEQSYLNMELQQRQYKSTSNRKLSEEREMVYRFMLREEELRKMPVSSPVLEAIDSMRDENGNIDYDQVYSQFDVDDIYSNSDIALQSVGILPVDISDGNSKGGSTKKK